MSMVNGRDLREVLADLRQYRKPTSKTNDGYGYFKTEEIVGAFDEIVGVSNYNVEYTDHKYTPISTGQELFSVKCIITILDDDGNAVLKRECYGGYVCKYAKSNGNDVNLQNSLDFVCSYAFKNAAKRFGIFGLKTKTIGDDVAPVIEKNVGNVGNDKSKTDKVMSFVTEGHFETEREKDGRPVYTISAHEIVSADKVKSELSNIIFYPNQYKNCAETFNKCIARCSSDKPARLKIKIGCLPARDGVSQYVFKGFVAA